MKQEEPEVPNKDPKIFQTLRLSAQSSSSAVPEAQKPAVVVGPMMPKAKPYAGKERWCNLRGTNTYSTHVCITGRPVIPPPGSTGTESGPRQPPTPPPSGVVEPPEPSNDQAKIKFWRDPAIQAEARLVERDRQLQQQGIEILDLSWKAKVAADWTQWWEHHRHEFTPLRTRSRNVAEPPSHYSFDRKAKQVTQRVYVCDETVQSQRNSKERHPP